MGTMVLVAVAVAVFTVGLAVVGGVLAWRSVGGLRRAATAARNRLEPLRSELAAEQATLRLELDGLQRRRQGAR